MKPPKCRLCHHEHWSNQPHVFAINKRLTGAINAERGKPEDKGSGEKVVPVSRSDEKAALGEAKADGAGVPPKGRTANRRSREKYNAYMKEYMRRKRSGAD